MRSTRINDEDIKELCVSNLPTRPTAPRALGGRGYTAKEMKEAFDLLPKFLVEKFNTLIDDIESDGEGGIASSIQTGITDGHTLYDLFSDILGGEVLEYISVFDTSLIEFLTELRRDVDVLKDKVK